LECIRVRGPVSRAQIARESGLSKPTVSQALIALEHSRLVREAGRSSGGKGPTAVLYEMNPKAGWVVGLDVGRDRVRAAIADLSGKIVAHRDEPARIRSADTLISQVGETARQLASDAGIRWRQVTFAAVGSPGVFEPDSDQVAMAHNLPGWGRHGILEKLREQLGTGLAFENDVNLATLGEAWRGLGRGVEDFVYLHVGIGVGMGLFLGGELYRGARGAAGEIGYLPLATADPHDPANRKRGALENGLGAAAILRSARSAGLSSRTPKAVFDAARKGDRHALKVVGVVAERIALAIAAVSPVLDPELVILGGSVGLNADLLLEPVRREVAELSPFRPRIEVSRLGDEAELHGAVALALESAREMLFARVETGITA
jgi:predicted NBD/HSP70 family sugar kinase